LFNINAQSMLRLVSTLCVSELPLVMSASFMFRWRRNLPAFSPRGFQLQFSQNFGPVWTSFLPTIRLGGWGVRK
jgi:hypothetical protein